MIAGAPVRAVLVLHLSAPGDRDRAGIEEPDGLLTFLDDRSLGKWLSTLDERHLDADGVDRVWRELSRHAEKRGRRAESRSGPPRPTLYQILFGSTVEAPLGFYAAGYASITPVSSAFGGWALAFVVPAVIAIGVGLHAVRRLRWFATGWLIGCVAVTVTLVVILIRALLT